jgi:four helix bundle protein
MEVHMRLVQHLVVEIVQQLRPVLTVLARKDRSLENQLRRAIASVALHLAEGVGSSGGIKKQRYQTALGSPNEVIMALELARSFGYVTAIDPYLSDNLARAGRMIAGLARRSSRMWHWQFQATSPRMQCRQAQPDTQSQSQTQTHPQISSPRRHKRARNRSPTQSQPPRAGRLGFVERCARIHGAITADCIGVAAGLGVDRRQKH